MKDDPAPVASMHKLLRMGDPHLLQVAEPVEAFDTPELHELIKELWATMHAHDGVGLAAPQIGASLRVVVFGFEHNTRYPDSAQIPQTVLINPEIVPLDKQMESDWEGCLSIPGMRGLVPRYVSIQYWGYDASGQLLQRTVSGFHARVVQHECDHLDGILYPFRIENLRDFGFEDCLKTA